MGRITSAAFVAALALVALAGAPFAAASAVQNPSVDGKSILFYNGHGVDFAAHEHRVMAVPDATKKQLWLVQFTGALNPDIMAEMKGVLGCNLGDHYGHYTFSAFTTEAAVAQARNLAYVKWAGLFKPEWKLSDELTTQKTTSEALKFTPLVGKHKEEMRIMANIRFDFYEKMRTWGEYVEGLERISCLFSDDFTHEQVMEMTARWIAELKIDIHEFDHTERKFVFMIPPGSGIFVGDFLSLQPEVKYVERVQSLTVHNSNAAGLIQSGTSGTTPIWTGGITGSTQYVAVADTGVDSKHCMFTSGSGISSSTVVSSSSLSATASTKIIRYRKQVFSGSSSFYNSDTTDLDGHGTHVAGSAVGGTGGGSWRGMAYAADLAVYDLAGTSLSLVTPGDLGSFYPEFRTSTQVSDKIFINTNSWSDTCDSCPCSTYGYTSNVQETDLYLWNHQELTVLFAAGNQGNSGACTGSVASPATAKNIITVGSSVDVSSLSSFSSIGPTQDGRVKPDILAPGSNIVSALTEKGATNSACSLTTHSGTSMATPITAGGLALIRQYFTAGFYPGGSSGGGTSVTTPQSQLLKAALFASVEPFSLSILTLSNLYGYGYVRLKNILYLSSGNNGFVIQAPTVSGTSTSTTAITQGSSQVYCWSITSSSAPFVVAMSYIDYKGTVGTTGTALVNDLNLVVTSPDGKNYRGNHVTAAYDGYHPQERVYIKTPSSGLHCAFVYARKCNDAGNQGTPSSVGSTCGFGMVARYAAGTSSGSTVTSYITVGGTILGGYAGTGSPMYKQSDLVSSGVTITLTLPSGAWVSSNFDAQRQNILDGLTAYDPSKVTGWTGVASGFDVTTVVRTSNTVVTITLPSSAFTSYAITDDNEYVKISIPSSAHNVGSALQGFPNIEICYQADCSVPAESAGHHVVASAVLVAALAALALLL